MYVRHLRETRVLAPSPPAVSAALPNVGFHSLATDPSRAANRGYMTCRASLVKKFAGTRELTCVQVVIANQKRTLRRGRRSAAALRVEREVGAREAGARGRCGTWSAHGKFEWSAA